MRQGLTLLFIATLALSACESVGSAVGSMGDGMKNVGNRIAEIDLSVPSFGGGEDQTDAENTKNANFTTLSAETTCPPVNLVPDLKQIHQFTDPAIQINDTLVSSAEIARLTAHCSVNAYNVAVEINLVFTGDIGPKAKIYATDEPNFSYPYFIALKTESGDIIAREAFAATLSYKRDQTQSMATESVRQIIPLNSEGRSTIQEILVGFQLEDSELDYNRSITANHIPAMPESAIMIDDFDQNSYSVFGD